MVTMARTDPRLGPLGVNLLKLGYSASRALDEVAASDSHIEWRQLCVIDRDGNAVARTGSLTYIGALLDDEPSGIEARPAGVPAEWSPAGERADRLDTAGDMLALLGFLDGVPGLLHISIGCINSYLKYAKLLELRKADGR